VTFAGSAEGLRQLDEALVQAQVVADRVFPALKETFKNIFINTIKFIHQT
jgi:hypothetical protein